MKSKMIFQYFISVFILIIIINISRSIWLCYVLFSRLSDDIDFSLEFIRYNTVVFTQVDICL